MGIFVVAIIILISVVKESQAIECYHCNSEYDPRCGDEFDPFSLGKVNCTIWAKPEGIEEEATLCRKITQKVYGKVRVYRGCGYLKEERDDKECVKRSGTHDVFAVYCACTTDLCNGAVPVHSATTITLLFGALAATIKTNFLQQFL